MVFAPRFDSQIFKPGWKNVFETRKKFLFLVVLHPCSRAEEEIEISNVSNVIIMRNINIHLPFRGIESTRKIMEGGEEKKSD